MGLPALLGVVFAFVAFRQWLRHQRWVLVHRERLAAIEKGIELPALLEEPHRGRLNVQRVLLLSGLIWLALGIGGMTVGAIVLPDPTMRALPDAPPVTAWLAGLIPTLVGVAHLIVYLVERGKAS